MQMSNFVLVLVASGALAANLVLDRVAARIACAFRHLHARTSVRAPAAVPCTGECS
jgi:hypothetical protein